MAWRWTAVAAAAVIGTASAACDESPPSDEACASLRDEFATEVWGPTLGKTCVTCHQPGGLAWEQHARFALVPATYPGFLDQNLESVRAMAGYEYDGEPLLLAKPTNKAPHGGLEQLRRGSSEYKKLAAFLERLAKEGAAPAADGTITGCVPPDALPEVTVLDPVATFRRASLTLTGRLPTEAEVASIEAGGEAALSAAVAELTREPAFSGWLVTSWNDVLLTDLYGSYTGRSLGLLSSEDFPNAHDAYYDDLDDETKRKVGNAVMREPLRLIVHVVEEGLPFGDILTADYMMVNPYSARVYDTDATFTSSDDPDEWRPGKLTITRDGATLAWPHAGILSSPMWLNRVPTTPTNLNRHRAWWLLKTFLATDLLTVASRPVDPDKASRFDYPWRQDGQCVVCHAVMDPIAGAWSKFDPNDQERYRPERTPPANVFDPGYGEVAMPPDPSGGPLRWLAQKVVRDERFPLAIARLTFTMLTGRKPIEHPRDVDAADYAEREAAWAEFDRLMTDASTAFIAAHLDYRALVTALVTSRYLRADGLSAEVDPARATELGDVGSTRLLTPELLDAKLAATTGLPWTHGWDANHWLLNDYDILYGGIDSDRVSDRLTTVNGVMAAVQARMANEVACLVTPWDFTKAPADRLLFPTVDLDDAPTTRGGDDVPAAIGRIRETLVHLYQRLLGETPDEAELARSFGLFKDVLVAGRAAVAAGDEVEWLRCGARKDPTTGADLPEGQRIEHDPEYTVRAWMAVVTYLLSDPHFLYQ